MKKLLGLFGAISLTAIGPSLVVSCNKNKRIDKPKINKDLAKKILVQISKNPDYANIDFGSMFTDEAIKNFVVNLIDQLLAIQYSFDATNAIYNQLGFSKKFESNENGIEKKFLDKYNLEIRTIAENKLFEEYTKSYGSTLFDYWSVDNMYNLNIQKETVINDIDGNQITVNENNKYIYISDNEPPKENDESKKLVWRFIGEFGSPESSAEKLPTIEQLTAEYKDKKTSNFWVKNTNNDFKKISSKIALYLRFQNYFESKLIDEISGNILTNAYLKSTMFDIKESIKGKKKYPYINPSSSMFAKTQTLNETSINDKWKTNVKMVWTLKYDVTNTENINKINKFIKGLNIINQNNGTLNNENSIKDIFNKIEENKDIKPIDDKKTGYDSYFGLRGFQGLTLYNKDNSLGTSPISGKDYETKIKEWNNGPGIVYRNNENVLFEDKDNKNYAELVIVLPIYMIELLGGSLTKEDDYYSIKGVDEEESRHIMFSNTTGNDSTYINRWNTQENKKLHSQDVQDLSKDRLKQQALLNQIMYIVSKDSFTSDLSKTIIYSKYLDKDLVYYAGLWDIIGKFIKNEKEDDE